MDLRKVQTGILAADFVRVPMVGQVIKYDFDNFRGGAADNRGSCRVDFNMRVRRSSHIYNFNFGLGSDFLLHPILVDFSGTANFIDMIEANVRRTLLDGQSRRGIRPKCQTILSCSLAQRIGLAARLDARELVF